MPDASGAAALEECTMRVQAIALIHERLYQSKDYANVPFADYLTALCNNVFLATGVCESAVRLELAIQPLEIGVDRAIPCGLILNELITNALKHAFPDGRRGVVRVEFGREAAGAIAFSVRDDGEGFPRDFDVWKSESMGMQLVCTLVEQLDAELEVSRHGGTSFTVRFGGGG
jgi:two-component sensor histidine kinase